MSRTLEGRVAVVTGATRGAGRGIARALGEAGATVYVTGRTSRSVNTDTAYASLLERYPTLSTMPGTVEDTAEEVTAGGGHGIPVRIDHLDPTQNTALVERVFAEQGRLDVLVNNAWGGHEAFDASAHGVPFWEQDDAQWQAMFERGVRLALLVSRAFAAPLVRQGSGLILTTTFWDRHRYVAGNLYYDLAKAGLCRLAYGMARELAPAGVHSIALTPGWMRTELVLAGHGATEATWSTLAALARTESPTYLGRAVVALAADGDLGPVSGRTLRVADLASQYGFSDEDGRQPPAFELER